MKSVYFYCITGDVNEFLYSLLEQIISHNEKIIIYSTSEEKMQKLDSDLWTKKKVSFIPHLLYNDEKAEEVPILISNVKENKYNFDYLLTTSFIDDEIFLNSFKRIYYIYFYNIEKTINDAEKFFLKYKQEDCEIKIYTKSLENKWISVDSIKYQLLI